MPPVIGGEVLNQDCVGIYNRINLFLRELHKSVSSGTSQMNTFDQARLGTYLDALDAYFDWANAQPQLDLPETHPRPYMLPEPPATPHVENEEVNDTIRLLTVARDEITNSQSARMPSGFMPADQERFRSLVTKAREFLANYISNTTPLDRPESAPHAPSSGHGAGGINP